MSPLLLHPFLVHFPIALFFVEALLLFLGLLKQDGAYERFASFLFRIGYGFLMVSFLTGLIDSGGLKAMSRGTQQHFYSATALLIFYTARLIFGRRLRSKPVSNLTGAVIGCVLVAVTAYLGGKLVYS